jgi:hypothetical protein
MHRKKIKRKNVVMASTTGFQTGQNLGCDHLILIFQSVQKTELWFQFSFVSVFVKTNKPSNSIAFEHIY